MDLTTQRAAARAALNAWEVISRLGEMSEIRSMTLTDNQSDDRTRAVESWNTSASVLGLPKLATDSTLADVNRGSDALDTVVRRISLDEDPQYRAIRGANTDAASGHASEGIPRHDQIRDQLASREYQHDYAVPESDSIRSLYESEDGNVRAISDFANGASLYVSDFSSQVAVYQRTASPWINLATLVTSDNGRPLVVPTLTGDPTVYTPGEGTAITASDVTLSTVTVTPVGIKALMYVSMEAFEDESINLTSLIARQQARAIGLAYGSTFTTTVLAGINNGGTATGAGGGGGSAGTAVATFVGYEDLIDLQYGRAAPYRANGVWIMANGQIKKTRKYRDGQGNYLWPSENLQAGQPATFLGNAVYEDPNLAAPASATKSVVYGDAAAGLIVKQSPLRVATSSDFKFDTDQIAIKVVQRISLAVQDASALAYLVSAAT